VTYISTALRRLVSERAGYRCEYCLLPEEFSSFPHEPDHITPLKHGGATTADNLALACFWCNRLKGSDLAALDPQTGQIKPLFNPRLHAWSDHC
jgi:5-methylcytosine-specific restriction endonuclease McrA